MSNLSFANIQPGQFELTPCRVTYKGVDLGSTNGNVVVKIEDAMAELKSDQLGSTVIDHKISGFKVTIETSLSQTKMKENWKVVFPTHKLIEDGANKAFFFDSTVGQSLRDQAGVLILHPLSKPDADKSGDIMIYLAAADGKSDLPFGPSEQQKLKTVWNMYPDFSTTPPRFMFFGDPDVGLEDATAGAASAGGGNVGNGTVSDIEAYSGATLTETITMQCVAEEADGGQFYVSGSQSGALGMAEVGTPFVSDVISFTINDGSTDFDVGDSFTIATVAANYE